MWASHLGLHRSTGFAVGNNAHTVAGNDRRRHATRDRPCNLEFYSDRAGYEGADETEIAPEVGLDHAHSSIEAGSIEGGRQTRVR